MPKADVVIIGGGIVGLATAYQLTQRHPGKKVIVLEKEDTLAQHQTGHNSGVLHSGIYYKPGSLKAQNCRSGKKAMEAFCAAERIDYEICGKVIVAVHESEWPALEEIYKRGRENGVQCEIVEKSRLRELEPHAAGTKAIHVPEAGIVNYRQVCERMAQRVRERDGEIQCGAKVQAFRKNGSSIHLETSKGSFEASLAVNCAGLHCDRVARLSGQQPAAQIVPFRGEYYELKPEVFHFCKNLIYPVPNPNFPFLGVHFTRMIDGTVECGPNAVFAFAREGYAKRQINLIDLMESLTYPGFIRMVAKYWRIGCGEMWRSFSKGAFVKALQRLLPDIRAEHLKPAPAGVRAQALYRDGKLVDDFLLIESERVISINNAPSPAATASLNVGNLIVDKISERWG